MTRATKERLISIITFIFIYLVAFSTLPVAGFLVGVLWRSFMFGFNLVWSL